MSFSCTCEDFQIVDVHILQARAQDADGEWRQSEIDLDQFVGNTDGWFEWDGENFSQSAKNIELEAGHILTAELTKADGDYRDRQTIDLDERIGNDNGQLVYL